jgi:hypothetical protein
MPVRGHRDRLRRHQRRRAPQERARSLLRRRQGDGRPDAGRHRPLLRPGRQRQCLDARNVNMVTCGGQATIPMVAAVSRVATGALRRDRRLDFQQIGRPRHARQHRRVHRDHLEGIETVGGAAKGKAIIVLNPAEPPLIMRDTVFVLSSGATKAEIEASSRAMVAKVQEYVPGYRLKQKVQFERIPPSAPEHSGPGDIQRPEDQCLPRGRRRRPLPARLRRQPRHHDLRRPATAERMAQKMLDREEPRTMKEPASRQALHSDVTLRDGMPRHPPPVQRSRTSSAIARRSTRLASTPSRSRTATACNGSSFNYGFGAHTDLEWIEAVAKTCQHAKIATLLLPGIGTVHDLHRATTPAPASVRVATHCTEATSRASTSSTRAKLGMDGRLPDDEPHDRAGPWPSRPS